MTRLPAIGTLINTPACAGLVDAYGRDLVTYGLRQAVAAARASGTDAGEDAIVQSSAQIVRGIAEPSLRQVVNATGILLHTNLGRAPLGPRVLKDLSPVVLGYSNVEFDLTRGKRGHRDSHVTELLRYLTGAEDALVVNNNAAALILILHHFANRKEVVVSRGELIEIGGSFRIPDIMRAGGSKMVEVGTTNKTRLSDYEAALTKKTALYFRAHKSNYAIHGFTDEPSTRELAAAAHGHELPLVYDLGSGLLRRPRGLPLEDEPDVHSALADGADLVTFSGDKLIGGPQAGVVVGTAALVKKLRRDPLMRALRVGKLTLAALTSACRHYLTDETLTQSNPAFAMMEQTTKQVQARAQALHGQLARQGIESHVTGSAARTGGGALPDRELASHAVVLDMPKRRAQRVWRALMAASPPVVGVMREGQLALDLYTVGDDDLETVTAAVLHACC